MRRIIKYFLLITNINEINLYVIGIKMYLIYPKVNLTYLIYLYLIFYLGQKYSNSLKNIIYIENSTIG